MHVLVSFCFGHGHGPHRHLLTKLNNPKMKEATTAKYGCFFFLPILSSLMLAFKLFATLNLQAIKIYF